MKDEDSSTTDQSDTMYLTIVAPKHGGLVIYESVGDGEPAAVFGGNLAEATKYFEDRAKRLQTKEAQPKRDLSTKATDSGTPSVVRRISENGQIASA